MAPLQVSLPERSKMAASVNNLKFTVLQSQRRRPRLLLTPREDRMERAIQTERSLRTPLCGLICKCIFVRVRLPSHSSVSPLTTVICNRCYEQSAIFLNVHCSSERAYCSAVINNFVYLLRDMIKMDANLCQY